MRWQATTAVCVLVGLASGAGAVFAKEYRGSFLTTSVARLPDASPSEQATGAGSARDAAQGRRNGPVDPAFELLASNPYERQLESYKTALNLYGESPLLEDPYSDTLRFSNPYENGLGTANPYVDALRDSEAKRRPSLDNPYTAQLRAEAANLENPYTRRR
jgi:hypothetical protein